MQQISKFLGCPFEIHYQDSEPFRIVVFKYYIVNTLEDIKYHDILDWFIQLDQMLFSALPNFFVKN